MTTGTLYIVEGDTYRVKHIIKDLGGQWDKERKAWIVDAVAAEKLTRQTYSIAARYVTVTPLQSNDDTDDRLR